MITKNKVKSSSKYTESFIPVRTISNGVIVLDNNQKVTGVKIQPKNIFILDQSTQDAIIFNLKNFYNSCDFEFWLISSDRPVDITSYLSNLQVLYNSTQDPRVKKLVIQDINKANMFTNNNVVDTEFYLLFKEKNVDIINKRIRYIISQLAAAGLSASQVSNDELRIVLDAFLNGGNSIKYGTVVSN